MFRNTTVHRLDLSVIPPQPKFGVGGREGGVGGRGCLMMAQNNGSWKPVALLQSVNHSSVRDFCNAASFSFGEQPVAVPISTPEPKVQKTILKAASAELLCPEAGSSEVSLSMQQKSSSYRYSQ